MDVIKKQWFELTDKQIMEDNNSRMSTVNNFIANKDLSREDVINIEWVRVQPKSGSDLRLQVCLWYWSTI